MPTDGGTVTNHGTIPGPTGISLSNGDTVINAGSIGVNGTASPFAPDAVVFSGTAASLLVLDSFGGPVQGSPSATNRVELAGTAAGTFSGLGSNVLGFGTVTIDGTVTWQVDVPIAVLRRRPASRP